MLSFIIGLNLPLILVVPKRRIFASADAEGDPEGGLTLPLGDGVFADALGDEADGVAVPPQADSTPISIKAARSRVSSLFLFILFLLVL